MDSIAIAHPRNLRIPEEDTKPLRYVTQAAARRYLHLLDNPQHRLRENLMSDTNEDVRQVLLESARIQFGALNAGVAFWSGWVECTSKLAQAANEQMLLLGKGGSDANKIVGRITDLSREYLRSLTELPNQAVARFNSDVAKPRPAKARRRAARAKD
jgi:hypothetical protein